MPPACSSCACISRRRRNWPTHARRWSTLFAHTRAAVRHGRAFHALAERPRVLLMVSQHGHCLNDLLYRWQSG